MVDIYEQLSEERKKGQAEGKYPPWFTTGGYQLFKEKIEYEADGYNEQIRRIADHMAQYAESFLEPSHPMYDRIVENHGDNWADCFYSIFNKGDSSPSSPLASNGGTDRGSPVSCSGSDIPNSVEGFYDGYKEAALLSKEAFGTSANLSNIQARGTVTGKGFKASGSLPVLRAFQQTARDISQGSVRRGSWAGYLEIDHGDFDEWADGLHKNHQGQNIGWIITKKFIQKLQDNDEEAHRRWAKALYIKMKTGKGYFWKIDHVNEQQPQMYKDLGLSNKASNLCVAPETLILTDTGYHPIADLEGESVSVWNGLEWSDVEVSKTGEQKNLLKVVTDSGYTLECTPYHKFYVQNTYHGKPEEKRANELTAGDKLIKFNLPIVQGGKVLDKAYTNGFYSADGCAFGGKQIVYLYHDKQDLIEHIEGVYNVNAQPKQQRTVLRCKGLEDKFFVPNSDYTIESRLKWLAGYMDGDGSIYHNGTNQQLVGCSVEFEFLREMQLMLQTMGVESKIQVMDEGGIRQLPKNDGSGENGDYLCKMSWRIIINSNGLYKLHQLGIDFKRLETVERKPQRSASHFIKVIEVVDEGRVDDTYCFTEHKRGMGMFGGILTGQCTEIVGHSDEDHTYSCVLMSQNATRFDQYKDTGSTFISTVMLDCVASDFIVRGKEIGGLEKVVRFTEKARMLGLGLMGFHSDLQNKNIAFESFEAHMRNNEIFSHQKRETEEASKWMAGAWGEPEWCKGYGVRGTHNRAVAPTMGNATLCGQISQGIEPWLANIFVQPTSAGEMLRINPALIRLVEGKGRKMTKPLIRSIVDKLGSVQHLDWLDDHEKLVFRTAFEIDQRSILRLAAARQRFIDQGQSLNLFFSAEEDEAYIAEIHKEFLLDPVLKGLYYIRSSSGVMAAKDECVACEG